jgi:hypothetical protein
MNDFSPRNRKWFGNRHGKIFRKLIGPLFLCSLISMGTLVFLSFQSLNEAHKGFASLQVEDGSEENLEKTLSISKLYQFSLRKNLIIAGLTLFALIILIGGYYFFRVVLPLKILRNQLGQLLNSTYTKEFKIFTGDELQDLEKMIGDVSDMLEQKIKYQDVSRNLIGDIALLKDQINEIMRKNRGELIAGPYQSPLNELVATLSDIISRLQFFVKRTRDVREQGKKIGDDLFGQTVTVAKLAEKKALELADLKEKYLEAHAICGNHLKFGAKLIKGLEIEAEQISKLTNQLDKTSLILQETDTLCGQIESFLPATENAVRAKEALYRIRQLKEILETKLSLMQKYLNRILQKDERMMERVREKEMGLRELMAFIDLSERLTEEISRESKDRLSLSLSQFQKLNQLTESFEVLSEKP